MAKSEQRRADILDQLADFVLDNGLSAASLRPLARSAGTSDRMLLYYFRDKTELLSAILEQIAGRLMTLMNDRAAQTPLSPEALRPRLLALVLTDDFWPYMRLWLEIAAKAGQEDPFCKEVGERIGRGFLAWIGAQLHCDTTEEHRAESARLFALLEGAVLLKGLGMGDVVEDTL